jgi:hypothetical protein
VSAGTAGARELPLAGNAGNLALHGCHHGYSSRRFVMPHDTTGRANPKPSSLGRLARATTLKVNIRPYYFALRIILIKSVLILRFTVAF